MWQHEWFRGNRQDLQQSSREKKFTFAMKFTYQKSAAGWSARVKCLQETRWAEAFVRRSTIIIELSLKDKANGDSCIKPCIVECNQQACTANPHSMKMITSQRSVRRPFVSFRSVRSHSDRSRRQKEINSLFFSWFYYILIFYDSFLFFLLLFRTRIIIKVKFKKKEPFFRSKKTFFSRLTTFRLNTFKRKPLKFPLRIIG